MGKVDVDLVYVSSMSDAALKKFMQKNAISLKVEEARKIVKLIGRNPTITELHIFNIQWSEHSSYKSSRPILKTLPTKAPNVILGPVEDSGIIELGMHKGEKYGIVMSHESHNHPSQVVPYEGAATGIGGIIRDILCMGSRILATADPLRFGNPNGKNKDHVKYVANEVINGIAGYSNAVGIPNIAGDIYFDDSFDDNCLVNVVCLGMVKEKDILHSYAPKNSEGYDIIVVGKPTDNSGFGGAAFASLILDEDTKESNKSAVQVPDPFLKNMIIRATYEVFREARKKKVKLGFKDMGAGGIMCASSELCADAGYGAEIDLDKVNVSMDIPSFIIACSETQERFTWISPKSFTKKILEIYNEKFDLGSVAENAKAVVVGKVTKKKDYLVRHKGKIVCNAAVDVITSGIRYERKAKKPKRNFSEPNIKERKSYNETFLKVLSHPNVASKAKCYNHYDKNVQGNSIIESGQADAGLIRVVGKYGVALSVDNNPRYGMIDPYLGAANATAEAMRNVAAVGAIPSALTDCLNFGNPEKPEQFYDFKEAVRGIKDAAEQISYFKTKNPVPIISGNVSFYNESSNGKAVAPSPVIACLGIMKDYSKAIDMKLKTSDSVLLMIGNRKDELGGSIYYDLHKELGKNVPGVDFDEHKGMIYGIIESIDQRLLLSCHDISDGGLATCLAEMMLGGSADGTIGMEINFNYPHLRDDKILFSESAGFVVELEKKNVEKVQKLFAKYQLIAHELGETSKSDSLKIINNGKKLVDIKINKMKEAWTTGFAKVLE
ncbi:phosphoribosylformylglycinamidine synthase subunit PurL [Candidatus Woesearchaeota archaeon]|nr:phosphoribosylformylglycinamidine synthase subunit PurL [Candidatus Woesearchaeota archaeon]